MGKRGYFVSFILLVLFGVNVLAEAASNHSASISQHSLSQDSNAPEFRATLHSTTDCPDGQHPLDADENCGDPCHTGRCHFGHCYHMVKGYSAMDPSVAQQGLVSYELLVPKAPFLEGPKRPPRHS